jgi:hypothetical protein
MVQFFTKASSLKSQKYNQNEVKVF